MTSASAAVSRAVAGPPRDRRMEAWPDLGYPALSGDASRGDPGVRDRTSRDGRGKTGASGRSHRVATSAADLRVREQPAESLHELLDVPPPGGLRAAAPVAGLPVLGP